MKTNSKTLQPNKINRSVFIVRLKHNLKKATMTELQLTLACVTQEMAKRQKGNKK